jgi:hypothetical protein
MTTPHPDIVEAYQNVNYINLDGPIEYDPQTGILELNSGDDRLRGTPGEVLSDQRFYCPGVNTDADRLNLAFEIGFLISRKQLVEGKDG